VNSKLIGNRYKFIETLGEGGYGKTFIAEDMQRPGNPRCVIKLLKHVNEPIALRLFQQEAETLEKLGNHDQIPRLLAHLEEDGDIFIVQELINGNPLSLELKPNCPWEEKAIIEMLSDCLQVIKFVHSCEVIHRDIKPDNIIRRDDGKLVLVDFGTVKSFKDQVYTPTVAVYSDGYTPNEQLSGKPKMNSDIYALGMIGIQAATGVSPAIFEQDMNGEVIWRHQAININSALADILSKMVKSQHMQRYQSVDEVYKDLLLVLSETTIGYLQTDIPEVVNEPLPIVPPLIVIKPLPSTSSTPKKARSDSFDILIDENIPLKVQDSPSPNKSNLSKVLISIGIIFAILIITISFKLITSQKTTEDPNKSGDLCPGPLCPN